MKVRNILSGKIHKAEWRTDHPASSDGQLVLVLENGEEVDPMFFEVLDEGLSDPRD